MENPIGSRRHTGSIKQLSLLRIFRLQIYQAVAPVQAGKLAGRFDCKRALAFSRRNMPPPRLLLTKNYVSALAAGDTDSRHSAMDTWLHEHEHGADRPLFGLKSWAIFELDKPPTGVTGPSATGLRRPALSGPPRPRESRGLSSCLCAFQVGVPYPPTVAETHRSSSAGPTSRPRPGQAQEQASGTMRRSGSPDQSRSRKKLRPCHGPWASGGRGQQAQHGRHAGPAQP